MKKLLLLVAALIVLGMAPIQAQPAKQTTTTTTKTKKDGTPDKRYKENKKIKKDGTPDKRYKSNKPAATTK